MPDNAISIDIPAEPPVQTVVLDDKTLAWQRASRGWVCVERVVSGYMAVTTGPVSWASLLLRGSVRVIWTPSEAKSDD